jgi:hypothetical protein
MTTHSAANRSRQDLSAKEIAIQAELLALNFALEGSGAERAEAALRGLSQELKQAIAAHQHAQSRQRVER